MQLDDRDIINLFNLRDERAIHETHRKYSSYLLTIAKNILKSREDSQECLNDTYLAAWNTIPPKLPQKFSCYLAKITRDISIDCLRKRSAAKRQLSEYSVSLSELEEAVPSCESTEAVFDTKILAEAIGTYLKAISEDMCNVFIWRYYYCDSVKSIADYTGWSVSKVTSMLYRAREGLKKHLESEEIFI